MKEERGIGIEKEMEVLRDIKKEYGFKVMKDINKEEKCEDVDKVVDVIKIKEFIWRKKDIMIEEERNGSVVNVKKGKFIENWEMKNVIEKIKERGNKNVMEKERGV